MRNWSHCLPSFRKDEAANRELHTPSVRVYVCVCVCVCVCLSPFRARIRRNRRVGWGEGGTEAGSYLRLVDSCITQLKAQGPSRTCNEGKDVLVQVPRKALGGLSQGRSCSREVVLGAIFCGYVSPKDEPASEPRGTVRVYCQTNLKLRCWVCGTNSSTL